MGAPALFGPFNGAASHQLLYNLPVALQRSNRHMSYLRLVSFLNNLAQGWMC